MQIAHTVILDSENTNFLDKILKTLIRKPIPNPDILEISQKNESPNQLGTNIGINDIKNLKTWIKLKPFQEQNKVAIIHNAERLTIQAQNSLLKILEEPPKHSYIIITTNNYKSLLPTILSRCELYLTTNPTKKIKPKDDFEIIFKNIEEKFIWIDKLLKKKERKEEIMNFFLSLHAWLIKNPNSYTKYNLTLLEKSIDAFNKNINNRLILENLFINLKITSS